MKDFFLLIGVIVCGAAVLKLYSGSMVRSRSDEAEASPPAEEGPDSEEAE